MMDTEEKFGLKPKYNFKWLDDAREELLEFMRGMDREEQSLRIKRF